MVARLIVDSDIPAITATGSTTARLLATRSAEHLHVKDFGAVCDGVTDDATAINAAISDVATAGGGTLRLGASHKIGSTVIVSASNVLLVGSGADQSHDVGTQGSNAGTLMTWAGAAGGKMMRFTSPTGASAMKMAGGGVTGVYFNANGANIGLEILSRSRGLFEDLFFNEFAVAGISANVVATLGEARDTQFCRFSRIGGRQFATTGALLLLDGDSTANFSLNVFEGLDVSHKDGDGLSLKNCDNNKFTRVRCFRTSGGTGSSIVFYGSNTSAAQCARSNTFDHLTVTAAALAKGTTSYTYPSKDNVLCNLDRDNSAPEPTIETGATCPYSFTNGVTFLYGNVAAVFAETLGIAETIRSNYVAGVTAQISNDADAHLTFSNSSRSVKWIFSHNQTDGRFRISLQSGTPATSGFEVNATFSTVNWSVGNKRHYRIQTSGVDRWGFAASSGAEAGSDAGSDYTLDRYSDAGTLLGSPIKATRSSGALTLAESGAALGFYGTTPAARPTVTGAKGGNAALTSLISALATLGLVTDSSS